MTLNQFVDINDVIIDHSLPKGERIAQYLRQIKNPYHFKCGKFTVKVSFAENGVTLADCVAGIIS